MAVAEHISNEYLSGIKGLELRTQMTLKGALIGWHSSPYHGFSSEFSQYRSYTPGDDLRYLDWKVLARSGKKVLKQFREETNTRVYSLIDSSASMDFKGGAPLTKWEYACILCAGIQYLAFNQRDSFGLFHGSRDLMASTPVESSASNLQRCFRILETLKPNGNTDLTALFGSLAQKIKSHSFVVAFTDLWNPGDISAGLKALRYRPQATLLVHLQSPEELDFYSDRKFWVVDLETGEKLHLESPRNKEDYQVAYAQHINQIRKECSRLRLQYFAVNTQIPVPQSLNKILRNASRFSPFLT